MQSEKPPEEWVYKGTGDCFAKIMKRRASVRSSRVPVPMLCVLWVLPSCLCCTARSRPCSLKYVQSQRRCEQLTTPCVIVRESHSSKRHTSHGCECKQV